MIMTAILDPSALDQKLLNNDRAYLTQTEGLLWGIVEDQNILLILDQKKVLLKEIQHRVDVLQKSNALRNRQRLQILLAELLKSKKKRFVEYKTRVSGSNVLETCCELERDQPPDAVITSKYHRTEFSKKLCASELIVLSEYLESRFEEKRKKYLASLPVHLLAPDERDELFIRTVRHASYLYVYDKQIGPNTDLRVSNLPQFYRGIAYLLNLWKEQGYNRDLRVVIVTCAKIDREIEELREEEGKDLKRGIEKIRRKLVNKLERKFGVRIDLVMKHDRHNETHARYLQTQSATFLVERGFDFIKSGNNGIEFKKTIVGLVRNPNGNDNFPDAFWHLPSINCPNCEEKN